MSDQWRITEHTANVAGQLADRWATAVAAQARRIQRPENTIERVPDALVQVSVLHQVLRAAEMGKAAASSKTARQRIEQAIEAFVNEIVVETTISGGRARALGLARNVLEHFDAYYQGTGHTQQPGRGSSEDLAQDYRWELDGPADGALRLRIGLRPAAPLVVVDLVEHAPRASRQLARALGSGHEG